MQIMLLSTATLAIEIFIALAGAYSDNETCERLDPNEERNSLMNTLSIVLRERTQCSCQLKATKQGLRNMVLPDCSVHYEAGSTENGIYQVSPDGLEVFSVYCNMEKDGWTLIQRRVDSSVNFDQNWAEYKNGFGSLNKNFWLGLDQIHLLTRKPQEIFFRLKMFDTGKTATALYKGFQVGDETTNFTMEVSPSAVYNAEMQKYIGPLNGFYYQNGMQFSTKDADNDNSEPSHCAAVGGGWWYNWCYQIGYLNAIAYNNMRISNSSYHPRVSESEVMIKNQ